MRSFDVLASLVLGELPDSEREAAELHLLSCSACAEIVTKLVRLGEGVRGLVRRARVPFFVSAARLEALTMTGLVTRTYRLAPGDTVACSVAPEDLYVASVLEADFHGLDEVDVLLPDGSRLVDVPFDAPGGVLVLLDESATVRSLPSEALKIALIGRSGSGEKQLGAYVFDHRQT